MLVPVVLNKQKYYVESESTVQNPIVYDHGKKLLGLKDVQKRNFKSVSELWHCLDLIRCKQKTVTYLDKHAFLNVCVQNLQSNGCKLNLNFFQNYMHGVNYSVVRSTDYAAIINLLSIVKDNCFKANVPVEYVLKTFELCNPVKAPLKISKWLASPYGQITKNKVRVMPLLYSHVLTTLYSGR